MTASYSIDTLSGYSYGERCLQCTCAYRYSGIEWINKRRGVETRHPSKNKMVHAQGDDAAVGKGTFGACEEHGLTLIVMLLLTNGNTWLAGDIIMCDLLRWRCIHTEGKQMVEVKAPFFHPVFFLFLPPP